jgi:DNA-binding transcriptional LysR family regulator
MLDVRRLRLLRELAHRGTIAAVAEALAFTPSAVSQQLSALEREAGVPLLERSGRRVVLTPAGSNLVRHAEVVLVQLERAAAELAGARHGLAGPLRIGTFASAARTIVPAALTELARRHPDLEPMVFEIDPAAVGDVLRAGELEVALIHEYDFVVSGPEPGLDTTPLCTEAMYLASGEPGVHASRSGAGGVDGLGGVDSGGGVEGADGVVIGRWRDAAWITGTPGTLCQQMAVRACAAAGFTPHVRHRVDDFTATLALVAAGQGVALVPQLSVADPPPGVVLTRVPLHRRTEIAYRGGAGTHPAVVAVTSALRSAVPGEIGRELAGHGGN